MAGIQLERRTDDLLFEWGAWARTGRVDLDSHGTLSALIASTSRVQFFNDEDAEMIDRIVADLLLRDYEMGTAIKMYYEFQFNYRKVGARLNTNKDRAQRLIHSGIAWVDAALIYKQSAVA